MSRPLLGTSASEIGIDREDREPIQSQIARQVRALVLSGRLKPQTRLPSTRALSEELGVARATVVEAYEQLASEGYLETRSGSGTRVAAELPDSLLTAPAREAHGLLDDHESARQQPVARMLCQIGLQLLAHVIA